MPQKPPWVAALMEARERHQLATSVACQDFGTPLLKHPYSDKSTNRLTDAVIDWVVYHGGAAKRVNSAGMLRNIKGREIRVKTGKGAADIDTSHNGYTIKIEIKCKETGDKLRPEQYDEYLRITRAGGLYLIVEEMPSFLLWWERYDKAVEARTFPLDALGFPLQPVIEPPRHHQPTGELIPGELPTLDEWKASVGKEVKKRGKAKDSVTNGALVSGKGSSRGVAFHDSPSNQYPTSSARDVPDTNILRARMAPAPTYVKHDGDNRRSPLEIQQAIHSLQEQGFKVALRQCLYYTLKPEDKVLKRLPKGYTCVSTPFETMNGLEWRDVVKDKNGADALDVEVVYEGECEDYAGKRPMGMPKSHPDYPTDVYIPKRKVIIGYHRRTPLEERFCIPEFIISTNNGRPTEPDGTPATVYVIDCKANTDDYKINFYVKVLKHILDAKGDTRKIKGGLLEWPGEEASGIHKIFKIT